MTMGHITEPKELPSAQNVHGLTMVEGVPYMCFNSLRSRSSNILDMARFVCPQSVQEYFELYVYIDMIIL